MEQDKSSYICKQCKNLLINIMSPTNFQLECRKCSIIYNINNENTLIYENITESILSLYHSDLKNILYDPTSIRICNYYCEKCKKNVSIKTTRIGDKMDLIKICEECKTWIN